MQQQNQNNPSFDRNFIFTTLLNERINSEVRGGGKSVGLVLRPVINRVSGSSLKEEVGIYRSANLTHGLSFAGCQ